jgi:hypothetical protein
MLTPPTDRLHKFIAISGVALIIFGSTFSIENYSKAELMKIELQERIDETQYAHKRFAQKVKEEMASVYRFKDGNGLKKGTNIDEFRKAVKAFKTQEPIVRKLEKEMNDSLIQARKYSLLVNHYQEVKKIWLLIGTACCLLGLILSYIGFKQWLAQPKSSR